MCDRISSRTTEQVHPLVSLDFSPRVLFRRSNSRDSGDESLFDVSDSGL
jgi:hypothetical protein